MSGEVNEEWQLIFSLFQNKCVSYRYTTLVCHHGHVSLLMMMMCVCVIQVCHIGGPLCAMCILMMCVSYRYVTLVNLCLSSWPCVSIDDDDVCVIQVCYSSQPLFIIMAVCLY